ncbi:hypothetical protein L3X38_024621 [Prunus dulcis]|uniref:Uncharacterized protein n=1 Tax=Prunus dulcis TaxID=3755 RepID=A0AAD4W089_PRUDU|nr:hypothetical protein L3X38_024621 [Prunus dulcis]
MSDNSERKSQSSPSTHAFSGEDLESDRVDEAWGTDGKSTEFEGMVEGLIVEKSSAGEEEQSISFGAEAYREMKRNYTGLEAVANRVLGITQALEVSSSGRGEASGSGTLVVASGGVNVPMGVPLPKRNKLTLSAEGKEKSFDLAIGLGVGSGFETEADLEVGAKLLEFALSNCLRYAEVTYDALPDEGLDSGRCNGSKSFCFDPFCETVDSNHCVFNLALSFSHGSFEVQPLLGEWPGADHRSQWFGRELWDVGKLLAFLTLLGEDALVNLPEDVVAFVLGQAPKVGEAEASLV